MRDVLSLLALAGACYLGGVLYLGWDGGAVGNHVQHALQLIVGHALWVVPPIAFIIALLVIGRSELVTFRPFRVGVWILAFSVLLSFGADRFGLGDGTAEQAGFDPEKITAHGGYVGAALYDTSFSLFGNVGTTLICLFGILLASLLVSGASLRAIVSWWAERLKRAALGASVAGREVAARVNEMSGESTLLSGNDRRPEGDDSIERYPDFFGDLPLEFSVVQGSDQGEVDTTSVSVEPIDAVPIDDSEDQLALLAEQAYETNADAAPKRKRKKKSDSAEHVFTAEVTGASSYILPGVELLDRTPARVDTKPADIDRMKRLLVETFGHFDIDAKVVGMVPGPRVSRYELSLAPGTKMSKVENMRKDLAYALATTEIRILAPIPGKSAVGIEVENPKPSIVTLGHIWGKPPKDSSPLYVAFGKDISGTTVGADLAKMPHLLVAGTTGAGKSGCMNAILSSLLLGASPDQVRMLLIDPKKVELSTYEGIPHLLTPVITNMKKAANALGNVVAQMEERYASMEIAGARTLPEFNKIRLERGQDPLPYILVVIDELADLIMTNKSDVEDAVIRVAQKGRAAGFHLVVATQRPSVDVITGMIKSNIPSRIAFAVSSQTDSRVILDQNGAETLLGSGDMLFKPVWARTTQRVQGAWIGESEVRALCDWSRAQREPDFDVDLLKEPETAGPEGDDLGAVDEDDRLPEAIRLVAEYQTCSASFFQRRMRVGYTRGARLVDMLERRGIVAPGEGPRPRQVLITMDDVPRFLDEQADTLFAAADAEE